MSNNTLNNDTYKKVICLNNKEIFQTLEEASKFAEVGVLDIVLCCKGVYPNAGCIKEENLSWRYYVDFLNMSNEEVNSTLVNSKKEINYEEHIKKVKSEIICLNTEKVYDDIKKVSEDTKISINSIRRCCNKKTMYCRDKEEHRYIFMYYEEYKHTSKEELDILLDMLHNLELKKVINLRTNEIYDSAEKASKEFYISPFTIRQQCYKKENYSKYTMEHGPEWLYYEDYLKLYKDKI